MFDEDIEIKKMQIDYDIGAWKLQILQNQKRIKEGEKAIRICRDSIKELENKVLEKMEERERL
jgi:hypothetical protein